MQGNRFSCAGRESAHVIGGPFGLCAFAAYWRLVKRCAPARVYVARAVAPPILGPATSVLSSDSAAKLCALYSPVRQAGAADIAGVILLAYSWYP